MSALQRTGRQARWFGLQVPLHARARLSSLASQISFWELGLKVTVHIQKMLLSLVLASLCAFSWRDGLWLWKLDSCHLLLAPLTLVTTALSVLEDPWDPFPLTLAS